MEVICFYDDGKKIIVRKTTLLAYTTLKDIEYRALQSSQAILLFYLYSLRHFRKAYFIAKT